MSIITKETLENYFSQASKVVNKDVNELAKIMNSVPKRPGVCIFVDMKDSTLLKSTIAIGNWLAYYYNFYNVTDHIVKELCIRSGINRTDIFIKGLGDGFMIFIPDDKIISSSKSYYDIFDCFQLLRQFNSSTNDMRIALHYCTDVHCIDFIGVGIYDYFGLDVDLTARLCGIVSTNRVGYTDEFYQVGKSRLNVLFDRDNYVMNPLIAQRLKGIPRDVSYYEY